MRIAITKSPTAYLRTVGGQRLVQRQLGDLIKQGHELEVKCTDGFDYTKETLVKIAFDGVFPANTNALYIDVITEFLPTSQLILIIENGGYVSYKAKLLRNAVSNGEYYFECLEELMREFKEKGGSMDELSNYYENTLKEMI